MAIGLGDLKKKSLHQGIKKIDGRGPRPWETVASAMVEVPAVEVTVQRSWPHHFVPQMSATEFLFNPLDAQRVPPGTLTGISHLFAMAIKKVIQL